MSKLSSLLAELCPDGVEYKTLGDITDLQVGDLITKAVMRDDFEYPVMGGGVTPTGYYTDWNRENCITISKDGASAGSIGWHPERFWATEHCFTIAQNESDTPIIKFVYYAMKAQEKELRTHVYGAGIPTLSKKYLWKFQIPVPPLSVQREIVRILDTFTELTAELTARRKQYEYYRDKLLTFKRKKNI